MAHLHPPFTGRRISYRSTTTFAATAIAALIGFSSSAAAQCQPEIVGSLDVEPDGLFVRSVAVSGTTAYVGIEFGMAVVDVADPKNPILLSSIGTLEDPLFTARHMVVSGTTVFFSASWSIKKDEDLVAVDVSDPLNPTPVGSLDFDTEEQITGTAISGDTLYATSQDDSLMRVVDISDPANMSVIATFETSSTDVAAAGDHVYLTPGGMLWVVDFSDPANPSVVGTVGAGGSARYHDVSDDRVYIHVFSSGNSSLAVIDVADPANPVLIGSAPTSDAPATGPPRVGVAAQGDTVYAASFCDQGPCINVLHVFDVSDPANPVHSGVVLSDSNLSQIATAAPYLYLAKQQSGPDLGQLSVLRNPCYSGYGACCVGGGCLQLMTEVDCASVGGTFLGAGSSCGDAACPDPEPPCPGDLTGNNVVGVADLLELLDAWGPCP